MSPTNPSPTADVAAPFLRRLAPIALAAFALALAPRAAASKLSIPPWLAEASTRTAPTDKDATVATLHDEQIITVSSNGKMTRTSMEAMRIITRDGRKEATVAIPYDTSSKKITAFKAWLIRPDGDGKTYGTKDTLDIAVVPDKTVYTELRVLILPPVDAAYEDCIFAYEYTMEDKGISGQNSWQFQSLWPSALSRITYKLPKDWTIKATMRNHAPIEPAVNTAANTYTWEMRDLPPVQKEPLAPSISRIAPFLDINLYPPPTTRNPPRISFPDWKSVSVNDTALTSKAAEPDDAVAAKASDLLAAAGANASLWNRINALARFAQSTNYVSIAMNLGKFGGSVPRPAPEVLKTGYGDCKDKTALLRALLKSAGIDSYAVWAYSGDRYYVNEKWPATGQFNHCITAIKITDPALTSYAIIEHPVLGRLLFFDPTDTYTPLGDLDSNTQGSQVLVLAGERGALLRLPYAAPADNRLTRTVEATLDATGGITVRLKEHSTGQAAAAERAASRGPKTKYDDWNRSWINNSVPASKILKTTATDSKDWSTFDLAIEFAAPGYAKMMRDKLLVFSPTILGRRNYVPLTKPTRAYPVILEPNSFSETAIIDIPKGYTVDELPPPAEATTSFGHYKATTEYDAANRQVRYHRELERSAAEIPASDYAKVRQFYETMRKAEQARVVLIRQ